MTQILVISDTHVRTLQELPVEIIQAIKEAEWVIHCGDFTGIAVVEELRHLARNFAGVYGNVDPRGIRLQLPRETILEFENRKIAVIHPHWGGYPDALEEKLVTHFPDVDAIVFGHTHDPCNMRLHGILLFNPGQGYNSFMVPASVGILTVTREELHGEILNLD